MQRSPHIFALNSDEAIYFSKLSPLSKIYNIYSYFDYHPTNIVGNHNILFCQVLMLITSMGLIGLLSTFGLK